MYPSSRMIATNQNRALSPAQVQPSASSSPPRTRRRTGVRGAGSAVWAIASAPRGDGAGHRRMDRADEVVGARGHRRDVVRLGRDTREDLADEEVGAARVLDVDVVRDPGVLVLELDLEPGVGRDLEIL